MSNVRRQNPALAPVLKKEEVSRRPRSPEAIAADKQRRHVEKVTHVLERVQHELELLRLKLERQIASRIAIEERGKTGTVSRNSSSDSGAQHVPEYDYPDFKSRIRALGTPVNGTVRIRYMKADGSLSERTAEIQFIYPTRGYPSHLLAFCQLRGEDRTFAVANATSAFDVLANVAIPDLGLWLQCQT